MNRNRASWFVLAGVLTMGGIAGGAFVVGCGSAASTQPAGRPSVSQLGDGLTVLEADPTTHVHAAFKANGHAVFVETRVGPLKPDVYRREFPNEPAYEMDARVVDDRGHTFTLVMGGDKLIDDAWGGDIAAGNKLPTLTSADNDMYFSMARDAGNAFAALGRNDLVDHTLHVTNATRVVPSERTDLMKRSSDQIAATLAAGVQKPLDSIGYGYLEGELYGKSIFLGIAHHSTVWGWQGNYDFTTGAWSWVAQVIACNHGTCANDSSMGFQGVSYSGGASNWVPAWGALTSIWSDEPTTSNSYTTPGHGCQSGYNWDTPPGHECNDDSSYELWQIHDSNTNRGYGTSSHGNGSNFCATSGSNGNACYCSSSCNNCSGDWSYPPVP